MKIKTTTEIHISGMKSPNLMNNPGFEQRIASIHNVTSASDEGILKYIRIPNKSIRKTYKN